MALNRERSAMRTQEPPQNHGKISRSRPCALQFSNENESVLTRDELIYSERTTPGTETGCQLFSVQIAVYCCISQCSFRHFVGVGWVLGEILGRGQVGQTYLVFDRCLTEGAQS